MTEESEEQTTPQKIIAKLRARMDALTPEQRAEMATRTERPKSLQTKLREQPEDPEDEPYPPEGHPYRPQILAVETREQWTELLREIQPHGYYVGLEDKEATEERLRNSIGRLFYIQNHVTSDYTESGTLDADLAFFTRGPGRCAAPDQGV